jgi:O-antigen/teichoic acid export membrane protein
MEFNQIKKYIFKNLYTGLFKTSLTLLMSGVAIPLIIKNIGIGNYGIISIVLIFSSMTGLLDLGLSRSLIYLKGDSKENTKEISAIYIINLFIFIIILLFGIAIFIFNINLLGKKLDVNNEILRWINFISIILLSLGIFNNLLRASLEANFKLHLVNWGFLIQSAIINMGWLLLAILKANIIFFLLVPIASSLITIIYHLLYLPHIYSTIRKPDKTSFKNVFEITLQFFKVGILNSIHLPLIKYIIIFFIGNPSAIGIFELATKLAGLANMVLSYISKPFFSIVAKYQETNNDYLWKVVKKVTKFLTLTSVAGYLVFIILNKYIIFYFFKEYSTQIFHVLNMVVIGNLFIASSESIQKFFLGSGKVKLIAKIKFMSIIANCIILLLLFSFHIFNLTSIALSYSISLVFIGFYWLMLSLKKSNLTI